MAGRAYTPKKNFILKIAVQLNEGQTLQFPKIHFCEFKNFNRNGYQIRCNWELTIWHKLTFWM